MEEVGGGDNMTSEVGHIPRLFKKRHRTSKWDSIVFEIKGTCVLYSTSIHLGIQPDDSKTKNIEISGSRISDVEDIPEYPHAFSITPKNSSRTYFFAAETAEQKAAYLSVICDLQFKSKGRTSDSSACVIQ